MTLDPDSPDHPYQQIAAQIRGRIRAGRYGPRLPTVWELSQEWDVAPATIQRALRVLKDEGLIYGIAGRGIFVR